MLFTVTLRTSSHPFTTISFSFTSLYTGDFESVTEILLVVFKVSYLDTSLRGNGLLVIKSTF